MQSESKLQIEGECTQIVPYVGFAYIATFQAQM